MENVWIALDRGEEDEDPLQVRRRIRGKTTIKEFREAGEVEGHLNKETGLRR